MNKFIVLILLLGVSITGFPQTENLYISKLELGKKDRKVFSSKDSMLTLRIDTLIMGDRSSLRFIGKKKVTLLVKHAEIGKRAYLSGIYEKNNASDFDIGIRFEKLGSLYVMANGQDANNTMKTDPNGDGGQVILAYDPNGIIPQQDNRKGSNYLHVDVSPGGRRVNPSSDIRVIRSMINNSQNGLRGVPQGQIYSGSPGTEGKVEIIAKEINITK